MKLQQYSSKLKVGDVVRAIDNYKDEQNGEFAPAGEQTITKVMDITFGSGQWVKTNLESEWLDRAWFVLVGS